MTDRDGPAWCPCGHPMDDDYLCIDRYIYGPCTSDYCGGVCEINGDCTAGNCACKAEEDQAAVREPVVGEEPASRSRTEAFSNARSTMPS